MLILLPVMIDSGSNSTNGKLMTVGWASSGHMVCYKYYSTSHQRFCWRLEDVRRPVNPGKYSSAVGKDLVRSNSASWLCGCVVDGCVAGYVHVLWVGV